MHVKQFEDKNLSHYSYAIVSDCEKKMVVIDPARNAQQVLDYAAEKGVELIGIIETHPHADFVSSHLELSEKTGATIYVSKLVASYYPHKTFDDGDSIAFGKIKLSAINTPGHSPDSICILLEHEGKQKFVFTGDTLFIGDCGRPDLREGAGNIQQSRKELAKHMYHSLRNKLMVLEDDVVVYPAHGAGTLCGKNLSKDNSSTIKKEKKTNWSLQPQTEEQFVNTLLTDQPFVPQYFPFDVEVNRKGAAPLQQSINKILTGDSNDLDEDVWVVDARPEKDYKNGHLPRSINLMEKGKFETWLGSIIKPGEKFYLAAEIEAELNSLIERTAAIGYERFISKAFVLKGGGLQDERLDIEKFAANTKDYTIVDVRNTTEVKQGKIFENSIPIPLGELKNRVDEIPTDKPIVVHCAAGYRSAAGSSIIKSTLNGKVNVFDLGEAIEKFK